LELPKPHQTTPLSSEDVTALLAALAHYKYPPCVWNGKAVECHGETAAVERYIAAALASQKPAEVKNGLVSVVCWGWGEKSNRGSKIAQADAKITNTQLNAFKTYRKKYPGGDIVAFAGLRLNQLGRMAFGTKVLAFMNLETRAVLDRKICRVLRKTRMWKRMKGWKDCNSITISARRAAIYNEWCRICRVGAACLGANYRAVDLERAVFVMSEERRTEAAGIIDKLAR
jgi:hypothetical protein